MAAGRIGVYVNYKLKITRENDYYLHSRYTIIPIRVQFSKIYENRKIKRK